MLKLLKYNSKFRWLTTSLFISELGSWFSYMLLIVLTYSQTNSLLTSMGVTGSLSIGSLLGGVVAGVLIENRRPLSVIVTTNFISGIGIGLLYFLPNHMWIYYLAAFFISFVSAFRNPAFNKFIVNIVDKDDLMIANGLFQSIREIVKIIGPGLAAAVLGILPEGEKGIGFLIDAASYLVACALLIGLLFKGGSPAVSIGKEKLKQKQNFWQRWVEGIAPAKSPIIGSILIMYIFIMIGIAGIDVTLTAHVNTSGYKAVYVGYIIGALSVGIILTSAFGSKYIKKWPLQVQLGGATAGFGLFYLGIGLSHDIFLMIVSAFFLGIFNSIFNMGSETFFQMAIPYNQLGRFFSVVGSFLSTITLIGMALNGVIGTISSAQFVIIISGLVVCISGIGSFFLIMVVNKKTHSGTLRQEISKNVGE
jgi:MFS family permease